MLSAYAIFIQTECSPILSLLIHQSGLADRHSDAFNSSQTRGIHRFTTDQSYLVRPKALK